MQENSDERWNQIIENTGTINEGSPYEWQWLRDEIWTGVGLGASAYGLYLIKDKKELPILDQQQFLDEKMLQKKIDD